LESSLKPKLLYVYLTPEKELIEVTDHNLNGEIDWFYFGGC